MRVPFAAKVAISAALLALAAVGLFAYLSFKQHADMIVAAIREELAATVRNAVVTFDGRDLVDPSAESVADLQASLDALAARNPRTREFHLFGLRDNSLRLLLCNTGASVFDVSTTQARILGVMRNCMETRTTCVTGLYRDESVRWITAFAPILDDDGGLAGMLAADRQAVEYDRAINIALRDMTAYSVLALVAAGLLGAVAGIRVTRPLRRLYGAALTPRDGHFEPVAVTGNDEISALTRNFNDTNLALQQKVEELAELNRELEDRVEARTRELSGSYDEIRKRRDFLQREVNIARSVQETIIPRTLHRDRIGIDVAYIPIIEIGGDMGMVLERSPTRYEVVVGDVTGHGLGAALVVNRVHTLLATLYAADAPLDSILHRLDFFLAEELSDIGLFLTLMACRFDLEEMIMECIGGGHVAALHYRPAEGLMSEVESRCGIIGIENLLCDDPPVSRIPVETGDVVLLSTDGLIEASNADGEAFGMERLKETIATAKPCAGEKIASCVVEAAKKFTDGHFQDDVLVVVIQVK